jgi:hypothetical protein
MKRNELYSFVEYLQIHSKYDKCNPVTYSTVLHELIACSLIQKYGWIDEKYGAYFIAWLIEGDLTDNDYRFINADDESINVDALVDYVINNYFSGKFENLYINNVEVDPKIYDFDIFDTEGVTMPTTEDNIYEVIHRHGKGRVNAFLKCFRPKDADTLDLMLGDWKSYPEYSLPAYNDFK